MSGGRQDNPPDLQAEMDALIDKPEAQVSFLGAVRLYAHYILIVLPFLGLEKFAGAGGDARKQ